MKKVGLVLFAFFLLVVAASESAGLWGAMLGHPLRTLLCLVAPFALVLTIGGVSKLVEKFRA